MRSILSRSGLSSLVLAGAASAALLLPIRPVCAQQPTAGDTITEDDVISGTMDIDFATRTNLDTTGNLKPGSAALGAKDTYRFTLKVAKTTEFSGTINRQPNLYSKLIASRKQDALLTFSIDLALYKPSDLKQKMNVGKWVGTIPIDTSTGAYDLAGGKAKESPLRIAVESRGQAGGFTDFFSGKLIGKAGKEANLAQYTYKRLIGDKTVQIVSKKTDPMRFERVVLAKGPSDNYPTATVTGRLDYDYETGNWFTDGIRFHYSVNGKEIDDVITGSIKWVEDPQRSSNGKGFYDFNLRFNEEKNKTAGGEAAAFAKMSDEDAFFAVDNSIPCLTGKISYVDTMGSGDAPTASKITYNLNANKLTKQQVMNFFKLWMVCVGPTNDE